jgi:hypothetical protein
MEFEIIAQSFDRKGWNRERDSQIESDPQSAVSDSFNFS